MSQNSDTKEVSALRAFIPFLCIMVGAMLFIGVGVSIGQQREKDLQHVQPDVIKSFTDCKVLDKQTVVIKAITLRHANTSCGYFSLSGNIASTMETGSTYDLLVTYSELNPNGYVSEATPVAS